MIIKWNHHKKSIWKFIFSTNVIWFHLLLISGQILNWRTKKYSFLKKSQQLFNEAWEQTPKSECRHMCCISNFKWNSSNFSSKRKFPSRFSFQCATTQNILGSRTRPTDTETQITQKNFYFLFLVKKTILEQHSLICPTTRLELNRVASEKAKVSCWHRTWPLASVSSVVFATLMLYMCVFEGKRNLTKVSSSFKLSSKHFFLVNNKQTIVELGMCFSSVFSLPSLKCDAPLVVGLFKFSRNFFPFALSPGCFSFTANLHGHSRLVCFARMSSRTLLVWCRNALVATPTTSTSNDSTTWKKTPRKLNCSATFYALSLQPFTFRCFVVWKFDLRSRLWPLRDHQFEFASKSLLVFLLSLPLLPLLIFC